jgi:hypothetical protein
MAGAATSFFTTKKANYQSTIQEAQIANQKLGLAEQAISILNKPQSQLQSEDLENIVALYQELSQ